MSGGQSGDQASNTLNRVKGSPFGREQPITSLSGLRVEKSIRVKLRRFPDHGIEVRSTNVVGKRSMKKNNPRTRAVHQSVHWRGAALRQAWRSRGMGARSRLQAAAHSCLRSAFEGSAGLSVPQPEEPIQAL